MLDTLFHSMKQTSLINVSSYIFCYLISLTENKLFTVNLA
jgi:hypothetical protein